MTPTISAPPVPNDFVTYREASRLINRPEATIRGWVTRGFLPAELKDGHPTGRVPLTVCRELHASHKMTGRRSVSTPQGIVHVTTRAPLPVAPAVMRARPEPPAPPAPALQQPTLFDGAALDELRSIRQLLERLTKAWGC